MSRRPCICTLFPYTTLFRSHALLGARARGDRTFAHTAAIRAAAVCAKVRSPRSEEHTSELQSLRHLVCRLLLEKKNKTKKRNDRRSIHYRSRTSRPSRCRFT